jgi:hypothetical protein
MIQNDKQGRDLRGRFGRGNQFAKGVNTGKTTGRPPRRYSIASALAHFADVPETIDDDGTPRTKAWLAARWLWSVVLTGEDRGQPVSFRDRLEAIKTIQSAIEPPIKVNPAESVDDEAELDNLSELSDGELNELERLLRVATDGQ